MIHQTDTKQSSTPWIHPLLSNPRQRLGVWFLSQLWKIVKELLLSLSLPLLPRDLLRQPLKPFINLLEPSLTIHRLLQQTYRTLQTPLSCTGTCHRRSQTRRPVPLQRIRARIQTQTRYISAFRNRRCGNGRCGGGRGCGG